MDQPGYDPEADLTGLEAALGRLRPAPIALDRDRMLFEAGRASALAERRGRVGYAIAAGFALVAVGLGGLLAREQAARKELEVKIASLAPPAPSAMRPAVATVELNMSGRLSPDSYILLSRRISVEGLDPLPGGSTSLPAEAGSKAPTPTMEPLRVRDAGGLLDL